jgi:CheY-like chemotaxis protein
MHILIVDDDPTISFLLTLALEDAGYTVASVANGQAALERLRASTERPCLILLDLMMPPLNGWEFRAQQLADPALASIPVVVLSAARPSDERAEALQAVAVLKKPVDFAAVLALVAQYCTASGMPGGAA